jgi:hypothetical protein
MEPFSSLSKDQSEGTFLVSVASTDTSWSSLGSTDSWSSLQASFKQDGDVLFVFPLMSFTRKTEAKLLIDKIHSC